MQRIIFHVNVVDPEFIGILVASAKPVLGSYVEAVPAAINARWERAAELAKAEVEGSGEVAFLARVKNDGVTARLEGPSAHAPWAIAAALAALEVGFLITIEEDPLSGVTQFKIDEGLPREEITALRLKVLPELAKG